MYAHIGRLAILHIFTRTFIGMTVSAGNVIPSKNNIPAFCRHRVDTSHFLIFTTRVGLKTKTKRGEIAFFRPVATESGNIIFWRV
jgi:hypothetical protein